VKIMLLCSEFNGLTQRVWAELSAAGHPVGVRRGDGAATMCAATAAHQPDLVICPFCASRAGQDSSRTGVTARVHGRVTWV
jgi:putative two-component system hydrogenase maturation factor HypX/HoxX